MLLRLAYLGVTNALTLLRLLPMSDRDKDAEILALRHQIMILERQLGGDRVRFAPRGPGMAGRSAAPATPTGAAPAAAARAPGHGTALAP
ncbi:hypothetical protein ACQP1S_11610 [Micromonospora matsumotoense]|uniref:hypothetical protein n=1 Tax=Micromonospora matsumotoense TaxID=121616 RepID=UPI003D8FC4C6